MPACPTIDRRPATAWVAGLALLMGAWGIGGCYYDVRDDLYGPADDCDTAVAVSYSADLVPLLELNCNSGACHGGGTSPDLRTHEGVAQSSTEGSLLDRIRRLPGDPGMMPKNGTPLPECDLQLFERWVTEG
ncbi:MAG: hypothetical protein ACPHBR_04510, partial [Flavobacteriales bacterium]